MLRWLVWGAFTLVWTTLLVLPGSTFTRIGLDERPEIRLTVAKSLHILAYAIFTVLTGWVARSGPLSTVSALLFMAHATATELAQLYLVENRSGTLGDVALDQIGILLGLCVAWRWWSDPR